MKTFITSINEKLYRSYGARFIDTWKQHARDDIKLIVCFEGDLPDEIFRKSSEKVSIISINSNEQNRFLNKFGHLNEAKGIRLYKNLIDPKSLNFKYNYRFDAIRFSFKIFSYIKCFEMNLIKSDFAWIDSDVVCLRDFDSLDLKGIFPENNQLASYLGRMKFPQPNPYSECGFVAYNFNHPMCKKFIDDMYGYYENGELFTLPEWHDCMVFDSIRIKYQNLKVDFKNLSAHIPDADHPFMQTELALYFDHLKGPERKIKGHS